MLTQPIATAQAPSARKVTVYTVRELKLLMLACGQDIAEIDAGVPQLVCLTDDLAQKDPVLAGHLQLGLVDLEKGLLDFPKYARLIFICETGILSRKAASVALTLGFYNAAVLDGGAQAWAAK